ncbi:nuclear factor NF-kappa-B p110 subunit [Asbolus verrucosus]|uniref:Nuclear factor NF-kappa-B p110 subunit n=1 Tax=Asbolus verrucosus TaxID=1661398 RepID=A0A482VRR7_ASBVE|nr:nuclear factor NF-kappa-B p110 subunit [Asbolus verrucosus]
MDHCTSPAKGGREIFILVERVTKKNIKVRFYELDDDDSVLWEDYGKFSDLDVHHQYAIVFKTPPYKDPNIKTPVRVYIELERPSDRARSEPKEFTYIVSSNNYKPGAKRARPSYDNNSSYDTSLASDELPVPINNLYIENIPSILDNVELQVTSGELQQALTNINSDEFQRIFNDFGSEYSMVTGAAEVTTDSPMGFGKKGYLAKNKSAVGFGSLRNKGVKTYRNILQSRNSAEENVMAKQVVSELKNFIKTHPSDDKAVNMLKHHLMQENKTNALHISIRENELMDVMFLLKMVYVWKQHELLNVHSDNHETALHIATALNYEEIVANLIVCKADVSIGDADMNTSVHTAVVHNASIAVFEKLLSVSNVKSFIDSENNDGNTALDIAIDNNNIKALKLLCLHGADINKQHKKSGFTPLRFAVEKQNIDVLKYILQHVEVNPLIEDFQGINPLQAALKKDNAELLEVVTEFMKRNDYCDVEVKNEIEDCSDDEFEEKFSVKLEQITPEELREMYQNIKHFSPNCLDDISQILDQSGTWQNLAELLDLGYLLRSGLCESKGSPTKLLLKLAIESNGDTVLQIRDFLENLDETQAVEIIDNMVRSQFV